jgi:nicotinate-nucleotide pyrophosphorylase (carboxylating)
MERFLKALSPSEAEVRADVVGALAEDLGGGDPTAALLPAGLHTRATVIAREAAVVCGTPWFDMTFHAFDPAVTVEWRRGDGESVAAGETLCAISGPVRALLSGERTALNFLQTLSGTATVARRYRDRVADLPVVLLDTRKTVPGLRAAQKYAVRCGGCSNHRMGLYDAILIKENHLAACGSITDAIAAARGQFPDMPVEIEIERLDQLREALEAAPDIILLDNFTVDDIRTAVSLAAGRAGGRVKLEASGGITLDNVRAIAETGVDRIAIGALTKDVRAIDLSMRMEAFRAASAG